MSRANRWTSLAAAATVFACAPHQPQAPQLIVRAAPLPLERSWHQLGLGAWTATLWGSGPVRVDGVIDLGTESSTVPLTPLLGHPLPPTARGVRQSDTLYVTLGYVPDPPGPMHTESTDDGSLLLIGLRVGTDTVRGEWQETTYGGGRTGIFRLVRCNPGAPSNHCMQPTRAPGH